MSQVKIPYRDGTLTIQQQGEDRFYFSWLGHAYDGAPDAGKCSNLWMHSGAMPRYRDWNIRDFLEEVDEIVDDYEGTESKASPAQKIQSVRTYIEACNRGRTHYEGCDEHHSLCAILKILDYGEAPLLEERRRRNEL